MDSYVVCKVKPCVNPMLGWSRTLVKYGIGKITVRVQVPNYVAFPDEVRRVARFLPKLQAANITYDWSQVPSGVRGAVQGMSPVWKELEAALGGQAPESGQPETDEFFVHSPTSNTTIPSKKKSASGPLTEAEAIAYAKRVIKHAETYRSAPSLTMPIGAKTNPKANNYIRDQLNLKHLSDQQMDQIVLAITQIVAQGGK